MKSLTTEATLEAKTAFEAYTRNRGIQQVLHYHCDNGCFADNAFIKNIQDQGQTISFCAAYAHFQNGRAEKRIRDIQEDARKVLLHCTAQWPIATSVYL